MKLRILYWNVDNNRQRMNMALEGKGDWDVVALQEPYRNNKLSNPAPPCRRGGRYEMVYHSGRAVLYISKRIERAAWTAEAGEDWAAVTFGGETGEPLTIWSVYSPNWKRDWQSPLQELAQREPSGRNVLVGDLNAHHPMWDAYDRTSMTATWVLQLAMAWDLDLLTPKGVPTRARQGQRDGTIDHAWATRNSGASYEGAEDLPGSDHAPQLVTVPVARDQIQESRPPRGYSWALLDRARCEVEAAYLTRPGPITTVEELEGAVETLMQELTRIADAAAPRKKRNRGACAQWWDHEVNEALKAARKAKREWRASRAESALAHYKQAVQEFDRTARKAQTRGRSSWNGTSVSHSYRGL
ncbi:hypothetical protein MFIFM68171_09726 [Madurella fahalii]|uniref:Endonuclease/exonuclease/phosphatase domain-containing protein n=1 Tax=Madurella fahalii TaxID=1157608 RepID=A0ABQ0GP49_9PEZI